MGHELKPPLGIEPEYIWKENRYKRLEEAIQKRLGTFHPIPPEWIEERNELAKALIPPE